MKRKTIFNTLILTLMMFSSLFVANLSPHIKVSAEQTKVTLVSGNKYKDSSDNYYEKTYVGINDGIYENYSNNTNYYESLDSANDKISQYYNDDSKPITWQTYAYFRYDPIVWQIVRLDGDIALLVSASVLANMAYQPTYTSNGYTTANGGDGTSTGASVYTYSNIRYWLNSYTQTDQTGYNSLYDTYDLYETQSQYVVDTTLGYPSLYDTAFTTAEKALILSTTQEEILNVDTQHSTEYLTDGDAGDPIFLLTPGDLLDTDNDFAALDPRPTDYALAHYATDGNTIGVGSVGGDNHGCAWLRGYFDDNYEQYYAYGSFHNRDADDVMGVYIINNIVPAMFVDITTMASIYERGSYNAQGLVEALANGEDLTVYKVEATYASVGNYVLFGSYPQTYVDCMEQKVIDIPEAGVSINIAGIILSSTILIGLLSWAGTIGIRSIKKRAR